MNYFKVKFILLLFGGLFLTIQADAQVCGKYSTTLNILSENGKKVENVFVQLVPIGKDETKGKTFKQYEKEATEFIITFQEGHHLHNKFKVIISAQQFETYEMELKFLHCKNQDFDVKLKPINENTVFLTGKIYDQYGARIPFAEITLKNKKNIQIKVRTNDDGEYKIELYQDSYSVEVKAANFKIFKIKNFIVATKHIQFMNLDVALNPKDLTYECPKGEICL